MYPTSPVPDIWRAGDNQSLDSDVAAHQRWRVTPHIDRHRRKRRSIPELCNAVLLDFRGEMHPRQIRTILCVHRASELGPERQLFLRTYHNRPIEHLHRTGTHHGNRDHRELHSVQEDRLPCAKQSLI